MIDIMLTQQSLLTGCRDHNLTPPQLPGYGKWHIFVQIEAEIIHQPDGP